MLALLGLYLLGRESAGRRGSLVAVQLDREPAAVAAALHALQRVRYDDRDAVVVNCSSSALCYSRCLRFNAVDSSLSQATFVLFFYYKMNNDSVYCRQITVLLVFCLDRRFSI